MKLKTETKFSLGLICGLRVVNGENFTGNRGAIHAGLEAAIEKAKEKGFEIDGGERIRIRDRFTAIGSEYAILRPGGVSYVIQISEGHAPIYFGHVFKEEGEFEMYKEFAKEFIEGVEEFKKEYTGPGKLGIVYI